MKVKLYKGPLHGKTYTVRDDEYEVQIRHIQGKGYLSWLDSDEHETFVNSALSEMLLYRMVKVSGGVISTRFKMGLIPAVHPDGSIYFQYVPPSK